MNVNEEDIIMLIKHTGIYFLSHGVPGIVGLLSLMIYTRMLSPEQYGVYALIIVITGLSNSIIFEWLRLSLLRFLPANSDDSNNRKILSTSFISFLVLMIIALLASSIVFFIMDIEGNQLILITLTIILTWSQSWFALNITLLRARQSPVYYGVLSFAKSTLSLLFSIFFMNIGLSVYGLLLGIISGTLISLILPTIRFWFTNISLHNYDVKTLKDFTSYGLPLTLTFAMNLIINSSDRVFIKAYLGSYETGVYSVAYDLIQNTFLNLMVIINLAAFPIVLKGLRERGTEYATKQLKKNFSILLLISLPSLIGMIILNDNIVNLFIGPEYQQLSKKLMPILLISIFLHGFKLYYVDLTYQLGSKTNLQVIPIIVAAALNIFLNYVFIPKYGIEGAAYSTLISYGVSIIISWYIGNKIFKLSFPCFVFIKIAFASGLMGILLFYLRDYKGVIALILQILVGIIVYAFALLLLFLKEIKSSKGTFNRAKGI